MVVCRAAELAIERVGRVVFIGTLTLDSGERISDFVTAPPSTSTELAVGPTSEDAATRLFSDLQPTERQWALDRYTPHPNAALNDPVQLDSFWALPWSAQVIYCRRSVNPPVAHQRRTADRLKRILGRARHRALPHALDTASPRRTPPHRLSRGPVARRLWSA